MFASQTASEENGRVQKIHLTGLTYRDVLDQWSTNHNFRTFFISILAAAPYKAFRWETPPVTTSTLNRSFEFVILDSPLSPSADASMFGSFLNGVDDVVVFPNLGKDAMLVVPAPKTAKDHYAHLAAFTRMAGAAQNHALWQKVGQVMQQSISQKPIWLNTAGAGVPWLHVRLDSMPKYYGYAAYKKLDGWQ